jgi:hypothetical protein
MKIAFKVSALALGVFLTLSSANATSPRSVASRGYTGSMDCASAKAYVVGSGRFFLSNYDCKVEVRTTQEREDQFGDRFGAFTFNVTSLGRAPASYSFSETGTYWVSSRKSHIYFNFGGRDYPRPGVDYSFGEFQRAGLVLATSVRGGTVLTRD